jgi:glycosyltransferase involved in cell wall biosynthesis
VIAGNAVLADWASDHNRDVRIIPSCVSPSDYQQPSSHELHDPPRLGWIGLESELLAPITEALLELNRRTAARLVLIGSTVERLGPLEPLIDRVTWSERAEKLALAEVDVGLMPLPDDPYNRGKCGYKLLQYSAASIPFVASPVGVNREILDRTGMPAACTPPEWHDAIAELFSKPADERRRLGLHARAVVERHYSYHAWLPQWEEAVGLCGVE